MRLFLFSITLLAIGFLAGYGNMWGVHNAYRIRMEEAPHVEGFSRLKWSIAAIEKNNRDSSLLPLIKDSEAQVRAFEEFLIKQRQERFSSDDFLIKWGQALLGLLAILAFAVRPRRLREPK